MTERGGPDEPIYAWAQEAVDAKFAQANAKAQEQLELRAAGLGRQARACQATIYHVYGLVF